MSRPRPVGEGLCQVRLLLPTMDAIAASARAAGEQRTPAQIRADAVTAMTLSTLRTSQMAAYQPAAKASDVRDGAPASLDDGGGGIDGDLSTLGSAPRSWASPNSPAPGCLLPDGVPLDGLPSSLSGLVSSVSEWWTPSGTGHLPLPVSIHVDVQVTVPITSLALPAGPAGPAGLAGLAPPADPTGSGDPGGGDHTDDGPDSLDSARTSPGGGRRATALEPSDREPSGTSSRSLPSSSGRSLPAAGGRSLPAPGQGAPAAQTAADTEDAEDAEVRIGARSAVVPAMTGWALTTGGTWRRLATDPPSGVVLDDGRTRHRPPAGARGPGARPRPVLRLPHLPGPS